jgi:CheY-like chemotaxis protein/two-component sensor histidine kinase
MGIVKSNVDRMADLVSDLLDISRIEAGRLHLEFESLDLGLVIQEISEELSESLRQRELTLCFDLEPGLPHVYADRRRVVQVLLNLLSNAYRYTPPGGTITIAVHVRGEMAQIDVIDTGIGIPEQIRARIFERFYRADHPVVRQQMGTGLGLPIAKSLIEMHGGELTLQSEVDHGSTFTFTLPLDAAQRAASEKGMSKVLVAEDDNDIRDLIAISLSLAGYEVIRAADGQQAVELAVAEKPALILLDVGMPHLTGYEVLAQLKEMSEFAAVPVVFLSAKGQESEIETGLGLGACQYILKPFDPEELVAQVQAILADGARAHGSLVD